jgi:hypothetical protein
MSRLVDAGTDLPPVPTRREVTEKLDLWRTYLLEHGQTNCVLTRVEIIRELDRWLDALNDLRGR